MSYFNNVSRILESLYFARRYVRYLRQDYFFLVYYITKHNVTFEKPLKLLAGHDLEDVFLIILTSSP